MKKFSFLYNLHQLPDAITIHLIGEYYPLAVVVNNKTISLIQWIFWSSRNYGLKMA